MLQQVGYRVIEAPTPRRARVRSKTDALDALLAARSSLVLLLTTSRDRRTGELQSALQALTGARDQQNADRLRCINVLSALVRTHDLGIDARRALTGTQIATIASWRRREETLRAATARAEATRLAVVPNIASQADCQGQLRGRCSRQERARGRMAGRSLGPLVQPQPAALRRRTPPPLEFENAHRQAKTVAPIPEVAQPPTLRETQGGSSRFDQQIAAVNTARLPGDRAVIREAAHLIGTEVAAADDTVGKTTLRDHLTWFWHTSSGSAHGLDWQSHASGNFIIDIAAAVSAFHFSIDAARRMWQLPTPPTCAHRQAQLSAPSTSEASGHGRQPQRR